MDERVRRHLNAPTVISLIALFVAIGGAGYAAQVAHRNSVTSKSIKDGAVKTADLGDGAVTNPKLANGSVDAAKIQDESVGTAAISGGAVSAAKLGDGSVTGAKIADGSIDSGDLSTATVASLRDGCPSTMDRIGSLLCLEKTGTKTANWNLALTDCTSKNLRLPTAQELYVAFTKGLLASGVNYWTGETWGTAGNPPSQAVVVNGTAGEAVNVSTGDFSTFHVCVMTPTDG